MTKIAMKRSEVVVLLFVLSMTAIIGAALGSHAGFQRRVVGVMNPQFAVEVGLLNEADPFTQRVWFAPAANGAYEYRSAVLLIGVVPFNVFGNGTTTKDLAALCRGDSRRCDLLPVGAE